VKWSLEKCKKVDVRVVGKCGKMAGMKRYLQTILKRAEATHIVNMGGPCLTRLNYLRSCLLVGQKTH